MYAAIKDNLFSQANIIFFCQTFLLIDPLTPNTSISPPLTSILFHILFDKFKATILLNVTLFPSHANNESSSFSKLASGNA